MLDFLKSRGSEAQPEEKSNVTSTSEVVYTNLGIAFGLSPATARSRAATLCDPESSAHRSLVDLDKMLDSEFHPLEAAGVTFFSAFLIGDWFLKGCECEPVRYPAGSLDPTTDFSFSIEGTAFEVKRTEMKLAHLAAFLLVSIQREENDPSFDEVRSLAGTVLPERIGDKFRGLMESKRV